MNTIRKFWPLFLFLLLPGFLRAEEIKSEHLLYGIPRMADVLLAREGFALGYSQKYKQAIWVCYLLTSEDLQQQPVPRRNRFSKDPAIVRRPVKPQAYTRTGYDRGHLAPAADMAYAMGPMIHSFYMTNISPQLPGCNRGIWKRIEHQIREWAEQEQQLCVITGPLFKKRNRRMGENKIPIPYAFYKVVLDMTPPMKMIGFIVPNETSRKEIFSFAVSVDTVEALADCDFFHLLPDEEENRLEKETDFSRWRQKPDGATADKAGEPCSKQDSRQP